MSTYESSAASFGPTGSRWTGSSTLLVIMGAVSALLGIYLLFNITTSAATLALLVAIGLIFAGIGDILGAERYHHHWVGYLVGTLWVVTGLVAVAWPGVTLWALAVVVGVGLIVGGVVRFLTGMALEGVHGRGWLIAGGLFSIVVGILAIAWPDATVLVLAILLGVELLFFGVIEIIAGLAGPPRGMVVG